MDRAAVEEEEKRDGRFLMFSTDMSVDPNDMFTTYFQRDSVEKAFRTAKSELSLAPLRYRRKDRIDAYTTVQYIAYLLWSWAERTVRDKFPGMKLQQALNSLSDVSIVSFRSNKSIHRWTTRLTEEQEKLLNLFGATKYLHVVYMLRKAWLAHLFSFASDEGYPGISSGARKQGI